MGGSESVEDFRGSMKKAWGDRIDFNEPTEVRQGVIHVPYFTGDPGLAPDVTLPFLLVESDGTAREITGPSREWFDILSQLPDDE